MGASSQWLHAAQENNGIAFADAPAGPFRAVANLTWASPPDFKHVPHSAEDIVGASASSMLQLTRRERPELHMDPKTGDPTFLYNGASATQGGVYKAFSLVQPVGASIPSATE